MCLGNLEASLTSGNELAVVVKNLHLSYGNSLFGSKPILRGINLNVPKGKIYGLLGPSGCGKTSLLKVLMGLLQPDRGSVSIFGFTPGSPESGIPGSGVGYMPQEDSLPRTLTIRETFFFYGHLYLMFDSEIQGRMQYFINLLQLPESSRLVQNLSGGQKQRLSLAITLLHKPRLVVLDEPTVGVDPMLREVIWQFLYQLSEKEQTTIIITTHYIEEMKRAVRVGFMRKGQILCEDSPKALAVQFGVDNLEDIFYLLSRQMSKKHKPLIAVEKESKSNLLMTNTINNSPEASLSKVQESSVREPFVTSAVMNKFKLYFLICTCLLSKSIRTTFRQPAAFVLLFLLSPFILLCTNFCIGGTPSYLNMAYIVDEVKIVQSERNFTLTNIDIGEIINDNYVGKVKRGRPQPITVNGEDNIEGSLVNPKLEEGLSEHGMANKSSWIGEDIAGDSSEVEVNEGDEEEEAKSVKDKISLDASGNEEKNWFFGGENEKDKYKAAEALDDGQRMSSALITSTRDSNYLPDILRQLINSELITLKDYTDLSEAKEDIKRGNLFGALYLGPQFSTSYTESQVFNMHDWVNNETIHSGQVYLFMDESNKFLSDIVTISISSSVDKLRQWVGKRNGLTNDHWGRWIEISETVYGNFAQDNYSASRYTMVLGVTLILVFGISFNVSAFGLHAELESKAFIRNRLAGVNGLQIVVSQILANFLCLSLNTVNMILLNVFAFGIPCYGSIILAIALLLLQCLIGVCTGVLLITACSDLLLTAFFIAGMTIAFLFINGVFWPLSGMPYYFQWCAKFMPFSYTIETLRSIMLRANAPFISFILPGFSISVTTVSILTILSVVILNYKNK